MDSDRIAIWMNKLYYGDNLAVLLNEIQSGSIDLVYLDPPFNSQASYNVIFRGPLGEKSKAQIEAFEDTWHWTNEAEKAFDEIMQGTNTDVAEMIRAMRSFLKENDMMAYLVMMAVRLIELHRVLKADGSLYLHCDPTASHYLKLVMDAIFGPEAFRNEVIWKRTPFSGSSKARAQQLPRSHDVLLFYSCGQVWTWNTPTEPYSETYLKRFKWQDEHGYYRKTLLKTYSESTLERLKHEDRLIEPVRPGAMYSYKQYLLESSGTRQIDDVWMDINAINPVARERLGYPTQKPQALLERIISASSNEGDIVLDPFCGCGTTIHAAQKLRREWVGIDVTHLAISLIDKRLRDAFHGIKYEVHGTPKDIEGARDLALRDKYQFQWWAVSLVNAVPFAGKKKGADSGIDGLIYFKPEGKTTEKAIVSVKGGENVGVAAIRDLAHVVEREKAKIGVFITLAEPTAPMKTEAVKTGFYEALYGKYPRIQILTIAELFAGKQPNIPLVDASAFKRAVKESQGQQDKFSF